MPFSPEKYAPLVKKAISTYWKTLVLQSEKQKSGSSVDRGTRSSVTGGKQMDGFCEVVQAVLKDSGLPDAHIFQNRKLELPGYYRPTKKWDMVVVSDGALIAAMEFKSHRGSFGNNFNNRTEEALGSGTDLWVAHREGAFGKSVINPWLGWVMLLEDCRKSQVPVKVKEPHFPVFPEFKGASFARRYEILARKLVKEKLYNSAVLILASEEGGPKGKFTEPATDLSMATFLAGLAGHVGVYLAGRGKR